MNHENITPDQWLTTLAERMEPEMVRRTERNQSRPLRYTRGFPVGGRPATSMNGKPGRIGEAWSENASGDGVHEIFISPVLDWSDAPMGDEFTAAEYAASVVAHEWVHPLVGLEHGHKAPFKAAATALGLTGKMTATIPGPDFLEWVRPILATMPPFPAAPMDVTKRKKQTTRLVKIMCPVLCTDMPLRITRKWLDEGMAPLCPCCSSPMVESD